MNASLKFIDAGFFVPQTGPQEQLNHSKFKAN